MPTAGCCRLSIASTAKCILVCSPSLLKWACVTVNCCARLCAGQGLTWSISCPWTAHSLGDLKLHLEATPEFELHEFELERSIIQLCPARKWTSKPHKHSARGKTLRCTKNKEQPASSGWRNYSGPPGREGRDRTSHIMYEVAIFCQQRLIFLTSTLLTNSTKPIIKSLCLTIYAVKITTCWPGERLGVLSTIERPWK